MSINQIIKGSFNNLLNKEEDLYKERIAICDDCKLMIEVTVFGKVCNSNLYLNQVTNETSTVQKPGFKNGCGCVLASKNRVKEAHCPLNK